MQISILGKTTLESGVVVLRTAAGEYAGRTEAKALEVLRRCQESERAERFAACNQNNAIVFFAGG